VEIVLFPGERDRGFKLVSAWRPDLETVIGLFNGGGVNHPFFSATDPTRTKDVVGRVRWMQGVFDVAVSGYSGKEVVPLIGRDQELDKTRLGADTEIYFTLPRAGGGSFTAEGYVGQDINADSLRALVASNLPVAGANLSNLSTDFRGGYLMYVQNFGDRAQLAARYDFYDPNLDKAHDQFERWSAGLNYFWDGNTRLTVSYDAPKTERARAGTYYDPDDNLWTFQFQLKF
jgi:hypothetical protein